MGKKVYKCDVRECEKLFSSKFSLKRHNLRHINSKKHVCSHCQKAFSLPQYLEEHEYTHTGAKPFTFRQRGKLSIHRKNAHQNRMNDDAGPIGLMNGLGGAPTHLNNRFIQRLEQIEEEEKFQFDHHHHSQLSMHSPISGANGVPGVVNGNFDNQQLLAQNNFQGDRYKFKIVNPRNR